MANWQRKLRLQPEWGQRQDNEITAHQLAAAIARKLRALRPFHDESIDDERDEIADEFDAFSRDAEADVDDFDDVMTRLYDWGDIRLDDNWNGKKVCWVDSIGALAAGIGRD